MNVVVGTKISTTEFNHTTHSQSGQGSVRESTLMLYGWTKMLQMELTSVTNRLRSIISRTRHMQYVKANHLCWKRIDCTLHHKKRTSCQPVAFRKICKWSYTSGDLRDKRTLIVEENDNHFMVGSAGRSTWVSIRTFTFDFGLGSSTTSGLGSSTSSGSASTFAVWLATSFQILFRSSVQISTIDRFSCLLNIWLIVIRLRCIKKVGEYTEYEDDLVRQTNTDCRYDCLFITKKPVQLASFGYSGTSARMPEQNN